MAGGWALLSPTAISAEASSCQISSTHRTPSVRHFDAYLEIPQHRHNGLTPPPQSHSRPQWAAGSTSSWCSPSLGCLRCRKPPTRPRQRRTPRLRRPCCSRERNALPIPSRVRRPWAPPSTASAARTAKPARSMPRMTRRAVPRGEYLTHRFKSLRGSVPEARFLTCWPQSSLYRNRASDGPDWRCNSRGVVRAQLVLFLSLCSHDVRQQRLVRFGRQGLLEQLQRLCDGSSGQRRLRGNH